MGDIPPTTLYWLDLSILPNPRNLHRAESSENGLIPNLSGQTVEMWKIDSLIQLPVLEIKSRLLILSLVFLLCQVESLFFCCCCLFLNPNSFPQGLAELMGILNFWHNFLKQGKTHTVIIIPLKFNFHKVFLLCIYSTHELGIVRLNSVYKDE